MKLLDVEVTNFRNLRHVIVHARTMTVLIGENGAGKSNLLHAIRLLLDPGGRQLQAALTRDDINADALAGGEDSFRVRLRIDLDGHEDLKAVFLESVSDENGIEFVDIEGRFQAVDGGFEWESVVLPPVG